MKMYRVKALRWDIDNDFAQPIGKYTHSTHSTKELAELAMLALEREFWTKVTIKGVIFFFDEPLRMVVAETFVQREFGISLDEVKCLPIDIPDKTLIEFLKETKANVCWLVEVDDGADSYCVKAKYWNYDGEFFQLGDQFTHSTHHTRTSAEQSRAELEREFWSTVSLYQVAAFAENQSKMEEARAFLKNELDIPSDDDECLPLNISNEMLFKFLRISGVQSSWISKIDGDKKHFVLRLHKSDAYMRRIVRRREERDQFGSIVYAKSKEALRSLSRRYLAYHFCLKPNYWCGELEPELKLNGELSKLSHDSVKLRELADKYKSVSYNETSKELVVTLENIDAIFDINEILKKPFFSIEELSFLQIQDIEEKDQEAAENMYDTHCIDNVFDGKIVWLDRLMNQ